MTFFDILAKKISARDSRHANYLNEFFNSQDEEYFKTANNYLENYCSFLIDSFKVDLDYIVDSYLSLVYDVLVEQTRFMRKGRYRYSTLKEAEENVYSNHEFMFKYMIGLVLSNFFWKNHYDMFSFFREVINRFTYEKYLEVGCGHGLYFIEAIKSSSFKSFQAYDLSHTSIDITTKLIDYTFHEAPKNVSIELRNIFDVEKSEKYDFITMGEVLEHVEEPKALLDGIGDLMSEGGLLFLTTCANAPAIDHIYLFNSTDHIKDVLNESNYDIVEELIINPGDLPMKNSETVNIINYAAVLKREGK